MRPVQISNSLSEQEITSNFTDFEIFYSIKPWLLSFYLVITVCGLIGNLMVMMIILKKRDIRGSSFGVYLFGLALADFSVALVCLPAYVTSTSTFTEHPSGIAGDILCKTLSANNLLYYFGLLSIFTLTVISLERYAAVCKPLSSYTHSTPKRAKLTLCAGCLLCILLLAPNIYGVKYNDESKTPPTNGAHCVYQLSKFGDGKIFRPFSAVIVNALFLFPPILMIFCIIKTKKVLMKQANDIKMNGSNQIAALRHVKRREKTMTTVILVLVSFFVFYTPFQVLSQVPLFGRLTWRSDIVQLTIALVFSSCCINPLIYGFRSTLFQKEMKTMLCKLSCFTKNS